MWELLDVITPENIREGGIHWVMGSDWDVSLYEDQKLAWLIKDIIVGMLATPGWYSVLRDIYSENPDVKAPSIHRMWIVREWLESLEKLVEEYGADTIRVDKMVRGILRTHVIASY